MPPPIPVPLDYLGAVPGSVRGSIAQGSTQLVLNTVNHFVRVGHMVIVPVGGEAGGGARMTVGVGGTWPATSFANLADLLANWTHPATSDGSAPAAYVQDTGDVHYWDGANVVQPPSHLYHWRKYWPKALVAVVDAVDGATLTLDTPATVSSSGVQVWVDHWRIFADFMHCAGMKVAIPPAQYALSKATPKFGSAIGDDTVRNDVEISGVNGVSELLSPLGVPSVSLQNRDADDYTVRDLRLRGNMGAACGLNGLEGYDPSHPRALYAETSHRPTFERVDIFNGGSDWGAAQLAGCQDGVMRSLRAYFSEPRHYYGSIWAMQLSDCIDCETHDCETDSDWIHTAAELFKCQGSAHYNFKTRNGQVANNASLDPLYDPLTMTYSAGSAIPQASDPNFSSASSIAWSANVGAPWDPGGGGVRNLVWRQLGELGEGHFFNQVFARSENLTNAGDPIELENLDIDSGGLAAKAIVALDGGADSAQPLHIDGLVADSGVDLDGGSIQNATCTHLRYAPPTTVLGPNLNIPLIEGVL